MQATQAKFQSPSEWQPFRPAIPIRILVLVIVLLLVLEIVTGVRKSQDQTRARLRARARARGKPGPAPDWRTAYDAAVAWLKGQGVKFLFEPTDTGVCRFARFGDPDGNHLILHRIHDAPAA